MNVLYHHGIPGQRWGVKHGPPYPLSEQQSRAVKSSHHTSRSKRASETSVKTQSNSTSSKTAKFDQERIVSKSGRTALHKNPTSGLAKFLGRFSKTIAENQKSFRDYDVYNESGEKIGNTSVNKDSKDSLNIVWLGIKSKKQGNGYGTDVMRTLIEMAKKDGFKEVTLEVPGDSPDARHIYEKLGFVDIGKISDDDDVWGGLTAMKLDLRRYS